MSTLKERIYNILFTRKGEVPYKPSFGCDLFDYIDKPINVAIPSIKRSIIEGINSNEKEVNVTKVTNEGLVFTIHMDGVESPIVLDINQIRQNNVLRVKYANSTALELTYQNSIVISDNLPIQDLMQWLRTNWAVYGNWYMVEYNNTILLETSLSDISIKSNA